jgi:hypothetical protein
LQSGLAASAAALLPLPSLAAPDGSDASNPSRPELFVYDDAYATALTAAEHAQATGLRIASAREVFTHLWYHELDLRWRHAPMTLAGITTARGLHILETLALDRRMRVISREESPDRELIHWLIAPAPRPRSA